MKTSLLIAVLAMLVSGCTGPRYRLPGTWEHPKDLTMEVGERRIAISKGLDLMMPAPAAALIRSSDTNTVSLEFPDYYSAYIRAIRPGRARVILNNFNTSCDVTVIQRKAP